MEISKSIELVLPAFEEYYNLTRFENQEPFYALATFHSHHQQYFLTKSAAISESESNEYLFFAGVDILDKLSLSALSSLSWETGLNLVSPHKNHRNSDVGLVLITNKIMPDALPDIKSTKHYKSYKHMLQGWSHYRLIVLELSTGMVYCNRHGHNLKPVLQDIYNKK